MNYLLLLQIHCIIHTYHAYICIIQANNMHVCDIHHTYHTQNWTECLITCPESFIRSNINVHILNEQVIFCC